MANRSPTAAQRLRRMPSPNKRTQRVRKELRTNTIADDSSPTRPAKRRKKAGDSAAVLSEEETSSSLVADRSVENLEDDEQVITQVVQHLLAPQTPPQASKDHANSNHEAYKNGVQAYAKIAAQDWTYYITDLEINIGRCSEPVQQRQADYGPEAVQIDLGPSKMISRLHASVYFNRDEEKWWLKAQGRNPIKVDSVIWKQGEAGPLRSGEVIEIGGVEMMFVLPTELSPLHISQPYLVRAGLVKAEPSASAQLSRHSLPYGEGHGSSPRATSVRGQGFQKPLAPAPPDYKRPGTPPSLRASRSMVGPSPRIETSAAGPLMVNPNEADLSLDENRHIKPQYSYAQMITQAITDTVENKLNLSGIYKFIMRRYAYYRHQPASGWQNSIRHNLSLNKAFEKVPRQTDEPGKGMKWQLVPDSRDDMVRSAYRGGRGGHRGSSNPSSPSQLSLNYITHGPREMAARDPITVTTRKRKVSPSGSPPPRSSSLRSSNITPVRLARRPLPDEAGSATDGSPLPRLRRPTVTSMLGMVENAPDSPTLTSSYLQEDGASFVTPAPLRVHPKLAPPSTAQRPSQHMPTSSPAPFWKYADIGSTPLKPAQFDLSPTKETRNLPLQSSSPPLAPDKSPAPSPSRSSRPLMDDQSSLPDVEEEGFDLTKGFQSIGSYHAPVGHGKEIQPATNGHLTANGHA